MKTYRIDIYADIDENDIGKPVHIDIGEIRDLETGTVFTGKLLITDLVPVGVTDANPFEEE